ncbi:hypothetical protein VL20_2460 [Microcystis panniformis FACHB-1757]|uniref:Uncharacterized protein n=1 Tax=Microcystis panniformis FACHB-1757 TaxID=1638788 RepID=A0A0K1S0K7_9CHRO|nr:hypothetical protein VL20_2460 [Microcystis panniformis FACHB-1757]
MVTKLPTLKSNPSPPLGLKVVSSHAKLITCPIELKPLRGNDRHV